MGIAGYRWVLREKVGVLVIGAVVHFEHQEVVPKSGRNGLVLMDELVQQVTPASPLTANLEQNSLATG
jgi:hypothetical protein